MRFAFVLLVAALAAAGLTTTAAALAACSEGPVAHRYFGGGATLVRTGADRLIHGQVTVWDTCAGEAATSEGTYVHVDVTKVGRAVDGEYDMGIGGGFFGYGSWANEPQCDYGLVPHGPSVWVDDLIWGSAITFVVGENDQSGPSMVWTGSGYVCETDGVISPGDPAVNPTADADDCLSSAFVGSGSTCGTGGGDGGYWVILLMARVTEDGQNTANPPTTGWIGTF